MKKLIIAFVIFGLPIVSGCATSPTGADAYKGRAPESVFCEGEKALGKKHYKAAISSLEAFDALYPFDSRAEQASLDIIYAYYKEYEPDSAIAAAERYIRLYPMSSHVDYAYYLKGVVNMERNISWVYNALPLDPAKRDLTYMQQAFNDFQKLVQTFPTSSYAKDSRKRMIHIRSLLASHELQTAEFYYQRKAYVAAANRASYVVQHLPGANQIPEALAIMVKSYRAMGEQQLADDALQVLKLNYPNTTQFKTLAATNTTKDVKAGPQKSLGVLNTKIHS